MSAIRKDDFGGRLPTQIESATADQLRQIIASQTKEGEDTKLTVTPGDGKPETITLSPALTESLMALLRLVSSRQGFQMVPLSVDLTTQQAADLLNVSRPYLIKLLEAGDIKFTTVGRHRRIKAEDLFAYKARRDAERDEALSELAKMDAELLLKGY
ncbi:MULTISPECIES: helix-turn-helix domain-containing protein [unclassified Thalassospira]|jgi:excisionase family DNA binding protein|uniref:helix-turn-helix domain-containing protein n=1 Tax=unclassified Thalassospira TaxID=2648997 RepID=UPI001B00A479|nr:MULTISPECIES: helix-turn-helix domain-containing protein [unclassified Thalassospira]MBO6808831.1 excisionase family DNA-binding protein [Thalassospira sp.]MBO6840780.1 excisionase family DNA-binding protein [Thalassospira sp.]